jgi:hypothetical protein
MLLRRVSQTVSQPVPMRTHGVAWVTLSAEHRPALWDLLLGVYSPAPTDGKRIGVASSSVTAAGESSPVRGGDDPEDLLNASIASDATRLVSVYGVHVQHKDTNDLISIDAQRCKFEKFRSPPYIGRLEILLRRWEHNNPACMYRQVGRCLPRLSRAQHSHTHTHTHTPLTHSLTHARTHARTHALPHSRRALC